MSSYPDSIWLRVLSEPLDRTQAACKKIAVAFAVGLAALALSAFLMPAPVGHADVVAYLVNVTVRPGYNFANADQAIAYGQHICDEVTHGRGYSALNAEVRHDFATSDEFQASYLISQAINEICPAQIWQLRQSAAGYRPTATAP